MSEPQGSPAPDELPMTNTNTEPPKTNGMLVPQAPPPREIRVVTDSVGLFDTARFEHLQRIALVMAISETVPVSLCYGTRPVAWDEQGKIAKWADVQLKHEAIQARCMMIADQAQRWRMNPFELLPCASYIRNRLSYEGKVVHAAIESMLGIRLRYTYEGQGDTLQVTVTGQFRDETESRTIKGTVAQWRTKGENSPWMSPLNHERQLAYRGAREWARRHAPGVILGVVTDDETLDHDEPIVKKTAKVEAPELPDVEDGPVPEETVKAVEKFIEERTAEFAAEPVKGLRRYMDPQKFLDELAFDIKGWRNLDELAELKAQNAAYIEALPDPFRTEARKMIEDAENGEG